MELSTNYDKNAPASIKLFKPLPLWTEPLPKRHLLELCPPQHAGALLPPSAHVGQNRRLYGLRLALLGQSAGSPRRVLQE